MTINGGAAISVRSADTRDAISIAMIKKSMDTMKDSGDAIRKLMEQSVNPNLGKNIDIKV